MISLYITFGRMYFPYAHIFFIYIIYYLQHISDNLLTLFQIGNKLLHTKSL
ncbi:hypothetical protein F383_32779 [Gossypium arboreum]|uniref:Uncharacterized protein n=1 Tax=Gossypium arboreum TaxID=29729 RepID=A0A0B0PP62_GOSAR|nr:hypothetical protein F383_32779 [Gossypium arboreum]